MDITPTTSNTPITPTVTIDRPKWRTGGARNSYNFGPTCLRNHKGLKCCLGFATEQLLPSLSHKLNEYVTTPSRITFPEDYKQLEFINLLVDVEDTGRSLKWVSEAVNINDSNLITLEKKEEMLTKLFGENGINLVFTGKYTPEQIKAC